MLKRTVALFACLLALGSTSLAQAQSYPERPVTIVIGFGAGGPDTNARLLAAQLNEQTGRTFIVENKPGATGMIGAEFVARSQPDGYTLLMTPASIGSLSALHANLQFDLFRDFEPITLVTSSEASFLAVNPNLPVDDLEGLIAYAKDGNTVAYATTGIGTGSHLRMALFADANDIPMTHVPFQSPGEAVASVMNGETQALFITSSQALPFIREGRLKALAYDNDTRAAFLPEVPTIVEAGAASTNLDSGWNGLLAPAGTPPEILEWIEDEVRKALQHPDVVARLDNLGLEAVGSTPAEFLAALERASESMTAAVRAAGIDPQ